MRQGVLFDDLPCATYRRPKGSLLKWIGNKYRMAEEITAYFPKSFGHLLDVFLGSGAILATVAPSAGVGSDSFKPLIDIWQALKADPGQLVQWYAERYRFFKSGDRAVNYETIKARYNTGPNAADFLFLVRSCYGGVVRFRKDDGYMSTPIGIHDPISPEAFSQRVREWHRRIAGCLFRCADYREVMKQAKDGDLVYCDPPYSYSQAILYGAQEFSLGDLLEEIELCKRRGAYVALSIDGAKRSGSFVCDLPLPPGLFEREVFIEAGRCMLKRFQMAGQSLHSEEVADRLLLTY